MGSCMQEDVDNGRHDRFLHNCKITFLQIHEGDIAQFLVSLGYDLDILGLYVNLPPKEQGCQACSHTLRSLGIAEPEWL